MTFALPLETVLLSLILAVVLIGALLCLLIYRQLGGAGLTRLLRDEFRANRGEAREAARELREEVVGS